jgi:leucyl/phenylalanyl-tRNA--protein transferase
MTAPDLAPSIPLFAWPDTPPPARTATPDVRPDRDGPNLRGGACLRLQKSSHFSTSPAKIHFMANRESAFIDITPEVLLKAYACGIFPMAESADDPALYWIEPEKRGIIPIDRFHVPARLARTVRSDRFMVTVNRDFDGVIEGCAQSLPDRPRTWINDRIRTLYRKLYERRHCHSIEVYDGEHLVGGLYGVTLGRAYFGESMFHRARDASKVALVHLVARLKAGGFRLLDTQFVTDHLRNFGAVEMPRRQYHKLLEAALIGESDFLALGKGPVSGAQVLAQFTREGSTPA